MPKFVRTPGPSGRIVRIRENEEFCIRSFVFQILEVDFVGEVSFTPVGHRDAEQPVFDNTATLVMDNRIETVVHRWLYDNLVPRLAECTDGCCKRWDHACRIENRIKPDLPSMPPRQPADEAFVP